MNPKTLLIDGDILIYKVGFACQKTYYNFIDKNGNQWGFSLKKQAYSKAKELGVEEVEELLEVDPEDKAKLILRGIYSKLLKVKGVLDIKTFLSYPEKGESLRHNTHKEYKANRKNMSKPVHYNMLYNTLLDVYKAKISESDMEADDELGLNQTDKTAIVTIDKDLWMIPGMHINLNDENLKVFHATDLGSLTKTKDKAGKVRLKGTGFKWFAAQMLLGDPADNIKGIKGMGDVKVYSALNSKNTHKEIWETVLKAYKDNDLLEINTILLWIARRDFPTFKEYMIHNNLSWELPDGH